MNFYIWLLVALVLVIYETAPYKHTGLYMAAAALATTLATLVMPTAPALCLITLWLALTALFGCIWIKKGELILKFYNEAKSQLVRQPPQDVPKILGLYLVGSTGEITCVFRDGFVQVKVDDQIKGNDIWDGCDEKPLTKDYKALKVGQRVKIVGYENKQLIVAAI